MGFKSTFEDSHPPAELKNSLSLFYWNQLELYATKPLFADYASGRLLSGSVIKQMASKIACFMVEKLNVQRNDCCASFYPNSDLLQVSSIGVLFAGAFVCAGDRNEPQVDKEYLLNLMKPKVVFSDIQHHRELFEMKTKLNLSYSIVIINDDEDYEFQLDWNLTNVFGMHQHMLYHSYNLDQPILVEPDDPAYILLTSGSTGKPKPVIRSHKNSLYVCHSFDTSGKDIWDLGFRPEACLAGHLPLDHGTGTFCTKMCLAKGVKLVLMENYSELMMLEAISKYKITDIILGSAFLHNMMVNLLEDPKLREKYQFNSVLNFLSVGSPLPSPEVACKFMDLYPNCSVRQTFGMTECGFVAFNKRTKDRYSCGKVGYLMVNFEMKLMELEDPKASEEEKAKIVRKEITIPNQEGEMYLRGPTVSPGYWLSEIMFKDQQKLAFGEDKFYRTFDVALIDENNEITIKGRCKEILCVGDGWKVLPSFIEQLLVKHEAILEASVVGIPNPYLPTCDAPRAYVVPRPEFKDKLTEVMVHMYANDNLPPPKRLVGGVKIMNQLPRVTLGKVDKNKLKRDDGY